MGKGHSVWFLWTNTKFGESQLSDSNYFYIHPEEGDNFLLNVCAVLLILHTLLYVLLYVDFFVYFLSR